MAKAKSRSSNGKNSRAKGHLLETRIAKDMRDIGYTYAKTTRQASNLLDNCQVDIAFVPLNIQCKSGYQTARPKADVIFKEITELLQKNYPPTDPQHNYPKVLVHRLPGGCQLATIEYSFLLSLLKLFKDEETRN